MKVRINTPGPSFVVEANSVEEAAMSEARSLPVGRGQRMEHSVQVQDGREMRYVTVKSRSGKTVAGLVAYPEV